MEKSVTESGVIVNVSTDNKSLLLERKKLKNFIQVIDGELESRKKRSGVDNGAKRDREERLCQSGR